MATEVRIAFAFNGGVSLAIWIGGVADEVLRFVAAGKRAAHGESDATDPRLALCRELGVVPTVDILAGTSAGGLNAACLATGITHGCANLDPIKELWLDHGSFDRLLRRPTDPSLISVLNGDENFLPHIEAAFELLAKTGTGFAAVDPPVMVRLTATSLGGWVTTISDGHGEISSVDHRVEFLFTTADFDFGADHLAVARLARACRSTASFPGAFEPSAVPVDLYERRHVRGLFDGVTTPTIPMVDGAVLVNLPAQSAIDAIIRQPSRERTERVLALVVPDPGEMRLTDEGALTLNEVLSMSIVGIPRTQSLTDFIRDLNQHNSEVRSRRTARDAMLAQFAGVDPMGAWEDFANVADALFSAYRATRVAASIERIRLLVPALLPASPAVDLAALDTIDADVVPWVANRLALGGTDWCWGSAPVRRMAAVLTTWVNTVAGAATPEAAAGLYAMKEKVSRIRSEADRLSPGTGVFETMFVEELRQGRGPVADAFERASRRWPAGDPVAGAAGVSALNAQLAALAGCVDEFVGRARSTIESPPRPSATDPGSFIALRGLLRLHDGAAKSGADPTGLLLAMEVIEATFSGTEPRPDQEIRLVQFASKGTVAIDELQRSSPADKLAGVELAHFGAFLKRSWRANDWMWGRLDAAERLVKLFGTLLGRPSADDGTLAGHTRAIQAAILREELPTMVAEIERDAELGGRVSDEGKAFCAAVRAAVATPHGPVDLSGLDEAQLQALLALQRVGSENLENEVGSNLATMTSIAALATTVGVVRAQGPRLLRAPIGLLGVSSSVAWRLAQRRSGRRLRILQGALVVAIGLIGLIGSIVDQFTPHDLGAFRYAAWSFLVLAPVLAVLAVPWLLVVIGRKLIGRQKPH